MSHAVDGTYIKAQQDKMVNSSLCKKASVDTYFNVMEVNLIIYNDDVIMMNYHDKRNNSLIRVILFDIYQLELSYDT